MAEASVLSALVVMRPPAGGPLSGASITSESVAGLMPDPAAVERARSHFSSRGFEVSEAVAISFSITGPRSVFEETFGDHPALDAAERTVRGAGGEGPLELPLDRLPDEVRETVEAVTFTPPPAFGPTAP
jgi:hypothetical protein